MRVSCGNQPLSKRSSLEQTRTSLYIFSAVPLGRSMKEALVKISRDSLAKWKFKRELGFTVTVLSAPLFIIDYSVWNYLLRKIQVLFVMTSIASRSCKILFFGNFYFSKIFIFWSSPVASDVAFADQCFFRSGWYSFTSRVYISLVGRVHVVTVSRVPRCKLAVTNESIGADRVVVLPSIGK